MTKRTLAAILSLMIILTAVLPSDAYGLIWDIKNQAEFMQSALKVIFGFAEYSDSEPEVPAIKILAIGNSFSNDSLNMVYDIAKSAGIDVVAANLNFNGCSLQTHWTNASSNNAYYTYQKWTSSGFDQKPKQTMETALLDEDWDYIILQQYSGYSGIYSTFKPYLNYLASYVKSLSPNARLALNMTWAYAWDSSHADYESYQKNQYTMYQNIVNAYQQASEESKIGIVIPCGTAIQNARTNPYLKVIGDELTRDGFHLNEEFGRYIAGLTVFETLIVNEEKIQKDMYDDVTFIPGKDQDTHLAEYAKNSVMDAVKKPFKTTSFNAKRK